MDLVEHKRRKQNRDMALFLIVPTAIVAKLIMHLFLPDKYFFDSWRMLDMLNNGNKAKSAWSGYKQTVNIHNSFNIFKFSTLMEFSIFYGIIMTIIVIIIVSRVKEMDRMQVLYTLMATGILNIYVFTINKEMIQILYFLVIYIVITLPIKNNIIKLIGSAGVFYYESISFRSYYIIMAALTVGLYCIFSWLRKRTIKKIHIVITIIACFAMVFVFFSASQYISPRDYNKALDTRDGTTKTIDNNGSGGATTAIRNPITVNGKLGVFMFDYVVNTVRMLVPVELVIKSPSYFPFFIYQILILIYIFKTLKNISKIDKKIVVALSCFIAYVLGSAVFEPDFGSWARHESTTFPVMQLIAYNSDNTESEEEYYETAII